MTKKSEDEYWAIFTTFTVPSHVVVIPKEEGSRRVIALASLKEGPGGMGSGTTERDIAASLIKAGNELLRKAPS